MKRLAIAMNLIGLILMAPANAQEDQNNLNTQLIESAELTGFLSDMDELCEMTDEIVFAQSVLLLAVNHNWEIWSSDFAGFGPAFYLFNVLEETQLPAIRLMRTMRQSSVISEDDLKRAESIFIDYTEMREVGQRIHTFISEDNLDAAATLYLERTIPMRRAMRADCYTVSLEPKSRIDAAALNARLNR